MELTFAIDAAPPAAGATPEFTRGNHKGQFHEFTGKLTSKVNYNYRSRSQWLQLPNPTACRRRPRTTASSKTSKPRSTTLRKPFSLDLVQSQVPFKPLDSDSLHWPYCAILDYILGHQIITSYAYLRLYGTFNFIDDFGKAELQGRGRPHPQRDRSQGPETFFFFITLEPRVE